MPRSATHIDCVLRTSASAETFELWSNYLSLVSVWLSLPSAACSFCCMIAFMKIVLGHCNSSFCTRSCQVRSCIARPSWTQHQMEAQLFGHLAEKRKRRHKTRMLYFLAHDVTCLSIDGSIVWSCCNVFCFTFGVLSFLKMQCTEPTFFTAAGFRQASVVAIRDCFFFRRRIAQQSDVLSHSI